MRVHIAQLAQATNVFARRTYFGLVKPQRSSRLGFTRPGRVARVFKAAGDRVAVGELIAELDQEALDSRLATVEANLEQARQAAANSSETTFRRSEDPSLEQTIADLEAERLRLQSELSNGRVVAPYPSMIAELGLHEGDVVAAGRPVLKVLEQGPPIIEVAIPARIAEQTESDHPIWVEKDGRQVPAQLTLVAPEVDRGTKKVHLMLSDGAKENWGFGELVEVHFWIPTARSGFWIPVSALQADPDGIWSVYAVVNDGTNETVSQRALELLQIDDNWVLANGSINDGDRIVVDGLNRLVPGQLVVTVEAGRLPPLPQPPPSLGG